MGVGFIQKKDGNVIGGPGTSIATVWDGNPADGNALVVCVFWKNDVTITSVTDSQSNIYSDCGAGRLARPVDGYLQILAANDALGGITPTVTVNWSGSATSINVYLLEYTGQDPATLWDSVTATGTATSGTFVSTGSFTPTPTDGAVIAWGSTSDTDATAGSGFTARCDPAGFGEAVEDLIFTSSIGSITASIDLSIAVTKAGIIAATMNSAPPGGEQPTRSRKLSTQQRMLS